MPIKTTGKPKQNLTAITIETQKARRDARHATSWRMNAIRRGMRPHEGLWTRLQHLNHLNLDRNSSEYAGKVGRTPPNPARNDPVSAAGHAMRDTLGDQYAETRSNEINGTARFS